MKKNARNLCGTDIGRTIKFTAYNNGTWNAETREYEGGYSFLAAGPILMITHKKNGSVNVRIGKSPEVPHGAERSYSPNSAVEVV